MPGDPFLLFDNIPSRDISPPLPFRHLNLHALDTETTLIPSNVLSPNGKTRLAAPRSPDLILGSWAVAGGYSGVAKPQYFVSLVKNILENPNSRIIFHNAPFDIFVLIKFDPSLRRLFINAINEGRVYDTMTREMLIQIAEGRDTFLNKQLRAPTLERAAFKRAGVRLTKDDAIRLNFDKFIDTPLWEIPTEFLKYAAEDAYATLALFCAQDPVMRSLHAEGTSCSFPVAPDAEERWGLLSEHIQLRGSVALSWLERFPLRVDLKTLAARKDSIIKEYQTLRAALVSWGWARITPKSRAFHLSHKALREALTHYAAEHGIPPALTDTGLLTLEDRFWSDYLPRDVALDLSAEAPLELRLCAWLRYQKLQKLLSTYLWTYEFGPEHYTSYWNLGARTTRTSSTRPNIQNIPKHRDSLRAMFVPTPGYRFVELDFKAAELAALAQIFKSSYGRSTLADDINAGKDPHIETARRLLGDRYDRADPSSKKKFRQLAKALNFGLPGGLGPAKFTLYSSRGFNVKLSLAEAQQLRKDFLAASPELAEYLTDRVCVSEALNTAAANLGIPLSRLLEALDAYDESSGEPNLSLALVRLRKWTRGDRAYTLPAPEGFKPQFDLFRSTTACLTGAVRGRASYTEAHNFPFQALIAAGLKLGLWNLFCAHDPKSRWNPVVQVHDSVLLEVSSGNEDMIPLLSEHFRQGLQTLIPDVVAGVDVEGPKSNWGKEKE